MVEVALGFLFAVACHFLRRDTHSPRWKWLKTWAKRPLERGFASSFTSAIYFSISILAASNYSLAKKDFDISADGFGIIETQIAFATTVASILPLLYPIIMGLEDQEGSQSSSTAKAKMEYNSRLREKFRLVLMGLVTALFIYPFVSQCIHNWAPTDVGQGNGPDGTTVVNSTEWAALVSTCFRDTDGITDAENNVIIVFELVGSLVSILVALWSFSRLFFRKLYTQTSRAAIASRMLVFARSTAERVRPSSGARPVFSIVFLLIPFLLSLPLLWGIFRLREVQKALAGATTDLYIDNDWTFGQVVAIVIFAPVLFDMVYCAFELE